MVYTISLYLMGVLYILAGLNHFYNPKFYTRMMPPYLPMHLELVYISGVIEIALGAALFIDGLRVMAAWGIIALLIAVFPANIYMFQERNGKFKKISNFALFIRLPIQLLLVAWAYVYTL
jgi:uncharacterized membrane protein